MTMAASTGDRPTRTVESSDGWKYTISSDGILARPTNPAHRGEPLFLPLDLLRKGATGPFVPQARAIARELIDNGDLGLALEDEELGLNLSYEDYKDIATDAGLTEQRAQQPSALGSIYAKPIFELSRKAQAGYLGARQEPAPDEAPQRAYDRPYRSKRYPAEAKDAPVKTPEGGVDKSKLAVDLLHKLYYHAGIIPNIPTSPIPPGTRSPDRAPGDELRPGGIRVPPAAPGYGISR